VILESKWGFGGGKRSKIPKKAAGNIQKRSKTYKNYMKIFKSCMETFENI
jgi:hypothetical protein